MFANILLNDHKNQCIFCHRKVINRYKINYCQLPFEYLQYLHKYIFYIHLCPRCTYKCSFHNSVHLSIVCDAIDEVMDEFLNSD